MQPKTDSGTLQGYKGYRLAGFTPKQALFLLNKEQDKGTKRIGKGLEAEDMIIGGLIAALVGSVLWSGYSVLAVITDWIF